MNHSIQGAVLKCMMKNRHLFTILIFVVSLLVFQGILFFAVETDIQAHAEFTLQIFEEGKNPPINFLYYLTLYLFAFCQNNYQYLLHASTLVLALSVTAKYLISENILRRLLQSEIQQFSRLNWLIPLSVFLLCFCFCLPNVINDNFYLGQFPPNVWHNSTLIFLMPFALLLFWQSYQQLLQPNNKRLWTMSILIFLNLLIKPSFIFVYAMVYPFFLLYKFRLSPDFWKNLLPIVAGVAFIALEYYFIFVLAENSIYEKSTESSIGIKPFFVWNRFSQNIPFSLLVSLAFPITYLIFYWKNVKNQLSFHYINVLFLAGIVLFSLLAETGEREYHGNFGWQNIISCYLLFFILISYFLKHYAKVKKLFVKDYLILGVFMLHFVTGILFIIRLYWKHTYY